MAELMRTKELAAYLKLHEITVLKYAAKGVIPAIRIGKVWRFDKEAVDEWLAKAQMKPQVLHKSRTKATPKPEKSQLPKKRKGSRK